MFDLFDPFSWTGYSGIATTLTGKAGYPTDQDLRLYLESGGLPISALFVTQLPVTIAAAVRAFEKATGRTFVPVTDTKVFDVPTGSASVLLIPDLLTLTSLIYTTWDGDPRAFTVDTDFRLERLPGATAYSGVRFRDRWHWFWQPYYAGQIAISGTWGYAATVPEDAWEAMLAGAALQLFGSFAYQITGGRTAWREKDRGESFSPASLSSLQVAWQAFYRSTVALYRRVVL